MFMVAALHGSFGIDEMNEAIKEDEKIKDEALESAEVYAGRIFYQLIIPCAIAAFTVAWVVTAFVIPSCPTQIVQSSLLGYVGYAIITTIFICKSSPAWYSFLGAAAIVGVTLYYVYIAWRLIPFAASNLTMVLQGVRSNLGIYLVVFLFSIVGFLWTALWFYVIIGLYLDGSAQETNKNGPEEDDYYEYQSTGPGGFVFFLLLISLYWTSNVILVSNTACLNIHQIRLHLLVLPTCRC